MVYKPKQISDKHGVTFTVRSLREEDLDALLTYVNALINEDTYLQLSGSEISKTEEQTYVHDAVQKISTEKKIHLVVERGREIIASAEVRRYDKRSTHVGEVGISIALAYRGRGLGAILMRELIDESKRMGVTLLVLSCFENNNTALQLYKKIGFRISGVIPGMYQYKLARVGQIQMYLTI